MKLKRFLPAGLLCCAMFLSACATHDTSVQRHTRHYVYQVAATESNPETQDVIAKNINHMTPFFDRFYREGKQAKREGLTHQQAALVVALFRNPAFLSSTESKKKTGAHANAPEISAEQRKLLMDNAIATFWDGYAGRP